MPMAMPGSQAARSDEGAEMSILAKEKKRRLFGLMLALFCGALATNLKAQELDCTLEPSGFGPYSRAELAALLPLNQRHILGGETAKWSRGTGVVSRSDSSRVKWGYNLLLTRDPGQTARLTYSFLPKNGRLILRVMPGSGPGPAIKVDDFRFRYRIASVGSGGMMAPDPEAVAILHLNGRCVVN